MIGALKRGTRRVREKGDGMERGVRTEKRMKSPPPELNRIFDF
jgi:hypothetical protein